LSLLKLSPSPVGDNDRIGLPAAPAMAVSAIGAKRRDLGKDRLETRF
jgi:hypothetical protein